MIGRSAVKVTCAVIGAARAVRLAVHCEDDYINMFTRGRENQIVRAHDPIGIGQQILRILQARFVALNDRDPWRARS